MGAGACCAPCARVPWGRGRGAGAHAWLAERRSCCFVVRAADVHEQRKPWVPLILEASYRPKGWLGIMLGSRLYFEFTEAALSNGEDWERVADGVAAWRAGAELGAHGAGGHGGCEAAGGRGCDCCGGTCFAEGLSGRGPCADAQSRRSSECKQRRAQQSHDDLQ